MLFRSLSYNFYIFVQEIPSKIAEDRLRRIVSRTHPPKEISEWKNSSDMVNGNGGEGIYKRLGDGEGGRRIGDVDLGAVAVIHDYMHRVTGVTRDLGKW